MAARRLLTNAALDAAKPAAAGARALLWDALVPALALRVTEKGHMCAPVQKYIREAASFCRPRAE